MSGCVLLAQFGHRGVRVDGGCHHTLVPEETTNGFELCAMIEHGGGETMTEDVGGFLLLGGNSREGGAHGVAQSGVAQPFTARTEKKCLFAFGKTLKKNVTQGEIVGNRIAQFRSERNDALLVSFTGDTKLTGGKIDIDEIQAEHFGGSQAGVIEQQQEGAIALTGIVVAKGIVGKEAIHLALAHKTRDAFRPFGIANIVSRIGCDNAFTQEITIKGSQCGKRAIDSIRRVTALHQMSKPLTHMRRGEGFPSDGAVPSEEIVGTVCERGGVGGAGQGRATALTGHIIEKTANVFVHGLEIEIFSPQRRWRDGKDLLFCLRHPSYQQKNDRPDQLHEKRQLRQ